MRPNPCCQTILRQLPTPFIFMKPTFLLALIPALFLTSCYVTPVDGPYNNSPRGHRAPAPRPGGSHSHRGHDHDRRDNDRRDNDNDRYDRDGRDRDGWDRDGRDRDGRDRDGRGPSGSYRGSSTSGGNSVLPFGALRMDDPKIPNYASLSSEYQDSGFSLV